MSFVQKSGSYGTRGSTNGRHGITWKFLRLRPSFYFFYLYCAIFLSLLRLLTASLDSIRLFVEADDTTHEEESTNSDRNDRTEVTDLGPFFHRRFSFLLFPLPLSFSFGSRRQRLRLGSTSSRYASWSPLDDHDDDGDDERPKTNKRIVVNGGFQPVIDSRSEKENEKKMGEGD